MSEDTRAIARAFCARHGLTILAEIPVEDPPGVFFHTPQERVTGGTSGIFVDAAGDVREFGSDLALAQQAVLRHERRRDLAAAVHYLLKHSTEELYQMAFAGEGERRWWQFWR